MDKPRPVVQIELDVGMLDATISLHGSSKRLSDEAHLILDDIRQNGLGITKLERLSDTTYYVEHKPTHSGSDIIRYFGYLAADDLQSDIEFVRPDGQPHAIQIDNSPNG